MTERKPILVGDIRKHAKRDCRYCWGRGLIVEDPPGKQREERLCGCAVQRFFKSNLDALSVDGEGWKWRSDDA
jgi:hypothetical protein